MELLWNDKNSFFRIWPVCSAVLPLHVLVKLTGNLTCPRWESPWIPLEFHCVHTCYCQNVPFADLQPHAKELLSPCGWDCYPWQRLLPFTHCLPVDCIYDGNCINYPYLIPTILDASSVGSALIGRRIKCIKVPLQASVFHQVFLSPFQLWCVGGKSVVHSYPTSVLYNQFQSDFNGYCLFRPSYFPSCHLVSWNFTTDSAGKKWLRREDFLISCIDFS